MVRPEKMYGDTNLYGYSVGILMIEGFFPRPPGAIGNAKTFPFPVLHYVVPGAHGSKIVHKLTKLQKGSQEYNSIIKPWIDGAIQLEKMGVQAITSSCGFTALFQEEMVTSVNIPVFMSSLMLIPLVSMMLGPRKKIGVLTADSSSLTENHLRAVGADPSSVVIKGFENCKLFNEIIYNDLHEVNFVEVEIEILSIANKFAKNRNVQAIILECSQLPPYAYRIQKNIGLPIFDYTSLITMVHNALNRCIFPGIC